MLFYRPFDRQENSVGYFFVRKLSALTLKSTISYRINKNRNIDIPAFSTPINIPEHI